MRVETMQNIMHIAKFFDELKFMRTWITGRAKLKSFRQTYIEEAEHNFSTKNQVKIDLRYSSDPS